jgi:hypothetical protein
MEKIKTFIIIKIMCFTIVFYTYIEKESKKFYLANNTLENFRNYQSINKLLAHLQILKSKAQIEYLK